MGGTGKEELDHNVIVAMLCNSDGDFLITVLLGPNGQHRSRTTQTGYLDDLVKFI